MNDPVQLESPPVVLGVGIASPLPPLFATVLKGSVIYATANFSIKALNFLLLPLYTRFLAPRDYGIVSLAETVAALIGTVFGLGLEPALSRLYFEHADHSERQRLCVSSILRFGMAVAIGAAGASLALGAALQHWLNAAWQLPFLPYAALAIGAAFVLQPVQFQLSLFQAQMRSRAYAALSALAFVLITCGIIALVVVHPDGATGMLLGKLLGTGATAAVVLLLLRPWLKGGWSWPMVRSALRLALPLMPHQVMALGLVVADRFLLARYRSLDEVGIYSLAYTCGMAMFLMSSSLMRAWAPAFYDQARAADAAPRLGRLSSVFAGGLTAIAIGGICLAPLAARVLDPRYHAALRLIPLVVLGYLFHGMFGLFQLPLMQSKRSGFIFGSSAAALAANLALNLFWIPRWGVYGAAWATVAAYALEAALAYSASQRVWPLPYRRLQIAAGLALATGLAVATQLTATLPQSELLAALGVTVALLGIRPWRIFAPMARDFTVAAGRAASS